ncbi:precorrin-6y C5,15-methyltransferase (decarboxylating) subunit CbiE [Dysgonomonas sp. Marseille-P4677]|uniref:precorrin-6y C5,15-methyltransferase (decarboxylating) subunit CbiE n=1 Tax=Dysgonomonas sp. Marseille-P4677 TaxID=2364790 RepID=UPI001913AD8D|nr:precorrin-6y C5,15-methyltransferase (decarboxylating) subunit CbiE [Dysgonomonas sp. Marseille-P4677]MBK5720380.1 precorrin-6y C5,15-methyltransferase (decarboxylating) subunit CbiE [Dysgonomonas sp. Marseille-P4677]
MKFYIIGIDDNREQYFSPEVLNIINTHTIFSGGTRHYEIIKSFLPIPYKWINITIPLKDVFQQYEEYREIVIFASGDPLFFGFANTIQHKKPDAEIILYPYFNSLQLLAHRILMPYQDMHIVSLTGRPWNKFDEALIMGYDKIGVLTDKKEHTPSAIASRMLYYGYDNYIMSIGELLGNKEIENYSTYSLQSVVDKEFAFPNNLILQKTNPRERQLGIPDNEFHLLNGRARMITKMPIRLLSLSLLDLRNKSVFWDIGFCTGSVSIEAKLQFPHLQIFAFEQRNEGEELIELNTRRFGTPGINAVIGDFTEIDISTLPNPDAVFIGGHGGKMNEIINIIANILNDDGTIVFNSVSDESYTLFIEALTINNLTLSDSIEIRIDDFNTIKVMKTIKNKQ